MHVTHCFWCHNLLFFHFHINFKSFIISSNFILYIFKRLLFYRTLFSKFSNGWQQWLDLSFWKSRSPSLLFSQSVKRLFTSCLQNLYHGCKICQDVFALVSYFLLLIINRVLDENITLHAKMKPYSDSICRPFINICQKWDSGSLVTEAHRKMPLGKVAKILILDYLNLWRNSFRILSRHSREAITFSKQYEQLRMATILFFWKWELNIEYDEYTPSIVVSDIFKGAAVAVDVSRL